MKTNIDSVLWLYVVSPMKFIRKRTKVNTVNYKMQVLRRKGAPKSRMELSTLFNTHIKKLFVPVHNGMVTSKWSGSGDFRARPHTVKYPTCKKELKKSLKTGVMGLTFKPSPEKAEAGRY